MVTLKFFLDQLVAPVPGGIGRYAENLAREVISRAPAGCEVEGIITPPKGDDAPSIEQIDERLPGLAHLEVTKASRRVLAQSWSRGLLTGAIGGGLIHSPSLFAPLAPVGSGDAVQTVVTVHDTVPWTHPETLTPNGVRWHKRQLKRAWQYAAAVVTPTHAVAEQVAELYNFGDRLRVIPGAPSRDLRLPTDADDVAERLELPDTYVLAVGTLEPRKGLDRLAQALAKVPDAVLVHAGPDGWGDVSWDTICAEAGLERSRVKSLGFVSNTDLAVVYDRATVLCMPSIDEGFGLPVLEAFRAGTAVVHTDVPALMEVAGGAGIHVPLADESTFVERLSVALKNVLGDEELRETLVTAGHDRVPIYSWSYSADLVWRLHADL
ncbi:glycosyltransferase family 4 protein [Gulosibacter faecalis]|uniref:Glycosyltransferase family 4 protein n=1 Tax=Gulosibacter faecalis TaxID=272240 RepID=A0ABW5UT38_9MICO|nr:glycosyltransferase family 1 protein [Gulosibacter faecalis]